MTRKIKKSCAHHKDQNYETCTELLEKITAEFLEQGLLDDDGYLRGMVTSLRRSGKSKKAIVAKLIQKQIPTHEIEKAIEDYDTANNEDPKEAELQAALKFARKKRLGPFDERQKHEKEKALNIFARNGYSFDIAQKVMNLSYNDMPETLF